MSNYNNLDKFGFPVDSPITQGAVPAGIVPWQYGIAQKTQARNIRTSQVNIKSFVKFSNTAIALGTIVNGGSALAESILTPQTPHALEPSFAQVMVGIFIGTSPITALTVNQIYPYVGGSQLGQTGKWSIQAGYDVNGAGGTNMGTLSVWHAIIINNSGATGTIQLATQWRYIQFNNGTLI